MNSPLETAKQTVDIVSVSVVAGALTEYLPPLAALFTIIRTVIRIYETRTFQRYLARLRKRRFSDGS